MLQTSENQLTLKQLALEHRKLFSHKLKNTEFDITTIEEITNNVFSYLIPYNNSPINISINIDSSIANLELITSESRETVTSIETNIFCKKFTPDDITSLADLYIHMLNNNLRRIPFCINKLDYEIIKPGQLSEIITEYLAKEIKS